MLPYLFLINGGDFVSREIKFRVWNEELEEMYELRKANYIGSTGIIDPYIGGDKSIWQQYTGLKDKNGVEIYEGDVVKGYYDEYDNYFADTNRHDYTSRVIYINNSFCVNRDTVNEEGRIRNYGYQKDWDSETVKVIGNIYENPELLEATK